MYFGTAWADPKSVETETANAFSDALFRCMRNRMSTSVRASASDRHLSDTLDLVIGGVEISLWIAEQWAADLRMLFPQLRVAAVSSNALLLLSPGRAASSA